MQLVNTTESRATPSAPSATGHRLIETSERPRLHALAPRVLHRPGSACNNSRSRSPRAAAVPWARRASSSARTGSSQLNADANSSQVGSGSGHGPRSVVPPAPTNPWPRPYCCTASGSRGSCTGQRAPPAPRPRCRETTRRRARGGRPPRGGRRATIWPDSTRKTASPDSSTSHAAAKASRASTQRASASAARPASSSSSVCDGTARSYAAGPPVLIPPVCA